MDQYFRKELVANPYNYDYWRVYADWLEEHGKCDRANDFKRLPEALEALLLRPLGPRGAQIGFTPFQEKLIVWATIKRYGREEDQEIIGDVVRLMLGYRLVQEGYVINLLKKKQHVPFTALVRLENRGLMDKWYTLASKLFLRWQK